MYESGFRLVGALAISIERQAEFFRQVGRGIRIVANGEISTDFRHRGNVRNDDELSCGETFGNRDSEAFSNRREEYEFRSADEIRQIIVGNEFANENGFVLMRTFLKNLIYGRMSVEYHLGQSIRRTLLGDGIREFRIIGYRIVRKHEFSGDSELFTY
ncbi:MAG: hypothetical protein QMC36_05485 [Patescibacteria group bacterium]